MSLPLLHAGRTNPGLSAQLDLRFAIDKSLTAYRGPTPSFSRASTGSYFDGSGVLRYANVNVLLYSEQFENAYWDKTGNVTITSNQVIAPDGKLTADLLKPTASNATHYLYRSSLTYSAGSNTLSLFVKYQNHRWVVMQYYDGTISKEASFDLLNGVAGAIGSGASSSIISAGNGWYRISLTASTASSSSSGFYTVALNQSDSASIQSWSATGTESVAIWGAQLESGSTVGTYCPTTSSANSAPRFNHTYNGTSWVSKGLLVEEQRTNVVLQSSGFSTASWTKYRGTVTANAANSPDGTSNASNFTQSTGQTDLAFLQQYYTTTATQFTLSVFAKANGKNFIVITERLSSAGERYTYFNVSTGSIGTVNAAHTAKIVNVGNGWYRCSITFTALAKNDYFGFNIGDSDNSFTCTDSGSVLFYGAMLESGAFSTSHIETTSASVTRSADVCQITGSDFSGFWNGTEGTLAVEADVIGNNSGNDNQVIVNIGNGTSSNRVDLIRNILNLGGDFGAYVRSSSVEQALLATSANAWPVNLTEKAAFAFKANDFSMSYNGASPSVDTSGNIPSSNMMVLGNYSFLNSYLNGHIARLRYYNKRLPNATLQQLSDPDPTLNLQFALNKTLTPVAGPAPSFSRASTGTYFNASGVLTSASINTPRFDHVFSGGQWVSRGLLIEEQRTNVALNSEDLSHSGWIKSNATVSANAGISPDGNQTADLIYPTTSGDYRVVYWAFSSTNGQAYSVSFYAKASGISWVSIPDATGANFGARFNVQNGTIGSVAAGLTANIQNCGNGWYRCSVSFTAGAGGSVYWGATLSDSNSGTYVTKNGTDGVLIWGAQVEAGAFPTSYIPTTTTSVTRSADVCQITGTSFGWMWNQVEGSVIAECDRISFPSTTSFAFEAYSDTSNKILLENDPSADYSSVRTGGVDVVAFSISPAVQPNVSNKSALAYKANDFAWSRLGAAPVTDTSGGVPYCNALAIGNRGAYGALYALNGHIAKLIYYPARLTNTKLQQLST